MREKVDIEKWPRKMAFKTFCNYDDPYVGITTTLNITKLVDLSKTTKNSFYGSMIYYLLISMDEIDAYKYGYGKDYNNELCVYKYDTLAATATVINKNNELNFTRYIKLDKNYNSFIKKFNEIKNDAEYGVDYYKIDDLENMNKIQVTCLPWIRFSNFKDPVNKYEKSSKPKICWGKYYEIDGEYYINFSLLVNHAFQDGYHIGALVNCLQKNINNIDIKLNVKELSYVKRKKNDTE